MMRRASALTIAALLFVACGPEATTLPASVTPDALDSPTIAASWDEQLPDALGRSALSGVIADADGFVVFGARGIDRPTVWASSDGIDWEAVALPGAEGTPSHAAASANATVLIGVGSTSRCAHPSGEFMWRREVGDPDWERVPFDRRLFCAGGSPAIAARDDLFMVAGMGTGDQPFAWRSLDGLEWLDARAGLPADLPPWALAATDREFIELGRGARTDVRSSADGEEWVFVNAPPVAPAFNVNGPGMSPVAVLATADGVLAVYQADDASTHAAWQRQADGAWAPVALAGLGAGDWITGGSVLDGIPYLFVNRSGGPAGILASSDLATWRQVAIPEVGAILGIASFDGRTVLVAAMTDAVGDLERSVVYTSESDLKPTD